MAPSNSSRPTPLRGAAQFGRWAENGSMADTLIKTVGFFWSVDDVYWGKPKSPGSLLGRPASAKKAGSAHHAARGLQKGTVATWTDAVKQFGTDVLARVQD